MKSLLLLPLILFFSLHAGQTHRFFYELQFKKDSLQAESQKKIMVLDVNPDETKYYDYSFLEKDSINQVTRQQNVNWSNQIPVSRKRNSNKNLNYQMIEFQLYSYPTEDIISWKLSDETKKYLDFTVQKAICEFGGRHWTAWFTKDIPFSEGPYKFQGLPGLVVLLEDSQKQYSFSFIKNKNLDKTYDTSNFLEIRYGNKPVAVTEKVYFKKALEYYNDPLHDIREGLQNGTTKSYEDNGVKYTKASELQPLIKGEQQYIRKYNNPIERNKAIKYPVQ